VTFVKSGIDSVIAFTFDRLRVQLSLVGWESLFGPSIVLDVKSTPHQSFTHIV
jgi:hypothetical protein